MRPSQQHTKTAKAMLELYKALPQGVQKEVRELIDSVETPITALKKDREKAFYQWLDKNRTGLPKKYKFDREEANERS